MMIGGIGPGRMRACASRAAVKEKVATAQSAIAQFSLCDLIFMWRTVSAISREQQRDAGNAVVTCSATPS
jgi:hypothetical protein